MAKMNVCQESAGLAYRLSDGVVCWDEVPVQMTADEHLEQENQPVRQSSGLGKAVAYAVKWLTETLSGGPILATEIEQLAHDADISESTLKRAKKKAGITSRREGFGTDAVFRWFLPETDDISSAAVIEPMP